MHVEVHEVSEDLLVDDGGGALQSHGVVLQPDAAEITLLPLPCTEGEHHTRLLSPCVATIIMSQ